MTAPVEHFFQFSPWLAVCCACGLGLGLLRRVGVRVKVSWDGSAVSFLVNDFLHIREENRWDYDWFSLYERFGHGKEFLHQTKVMSGIRYIYRVVIGGHTFRYINAP